MSLVATFKAGLPRLPPKNPEATKNPLVVLGSLTGVQWGLWLAGVFAWSADAADFFAISLTAGRLATSFNTPLANITQSITLTLLFRTVGAIIGGVASDRYGRKYPLVINLVICAVLSLATAFCTEFNTFLAVRALFGIAMGGIWSQSVSGALENLPVEARGIASGLLQEGYAIGYLVISCANLIIGAGNPQWQYLFYTATTISFIAALVRLVLPESQFFIDRRAAEKASNTVVKGKTMIFVREALKAVRLHWKRCIFAIIYMSAFNFLSHGSQDLYPTIMQKSKGFSAYNSTVLTIIGNCGAIVGGSLAGYASQFLGRRMTIIICCVFTAAVLPLWGLPSDFAPLAIGVFLFQAGVQGAWGIIPIYLTEISPVAFRATFPGIVYQIGNAVSASSAQIEATAGANVLNSKGLPDYVSVSAILLGVVLGAIIIMSLFGAEVHGSHFELSKASWEVGAGANDLLEDSDAKFDHASASDIEKGHDEKVEA